MTEAEGIAVGDRELEVLLGLMPDPALVVDVSGTILAANDGIGTLFGYRPGELAGERVELLVPERLRYAHRGHRGAFVAAPKARQMGQGLELYGRRKDGSELPIDVSLAPVSTAGGLRVVAAVRDVSERRSVESARAQLATIVQSSRDGIVSTTVQGMVTSWNPGAEALFGHTPEEAAGLHVSALVPAERSEQFEQLLAAATEGRPSVPLDTRWRRRDGSEIDVAVSVSPVRAADGNLMGFAALVRDITERKAAEAERQRLFSELAEAREDRERLLLVADRERIARDLHDLVIQRLFAVGMGLQAATRLLRDEQSAARINAAVDDLDTTIRDIRTVIFELEPPPAAASSLRAEALELAARARASLGFDPVVHLEGPIDSGVPDAVAPHLLAALQEALSNVARHAHASRAEVELSVGDDVTLVVTDDGDGVGEVTRTSGLANLRQRAEALGGSMELANRPDGGARLVWRIPRDAGAM